MIKCICDIFDLGRCFCLDHASITIDKAVRGKNLTRAEYTIKDYEKWVRVEVHDESGRYAWSNILVL